MDFLSCKYVAIGRFDILWSRDENMPSSLALDSFGAVGSAYNYAALLYYNLIASFKNDDLLKARDLQ